MAGGFSSGSRWTQRVLDQKMSRALKVASGGRFQSELQENLGEVADNVSMLIRASGRGGSGASDFQNFQAKVTESIGGRYTARLGWLRYPGSANERGSGGKLWYQYQNWGYQLFGGTYRVSGLGFLDGVDAQFQAAIERATTKYLNDIKDALQ